MQTFGIKYTHKIWDFQEVNRRILTKSQFDTLVKGIEAPESQDKESRVVVVALKRNRFVCPCCGDKEVVTYPARTRYVQSMPTGNLRTFFELKVHRIYCHTCGKEYHESFPFLAHPKARITRALQDWILELRSAMCISDISRLYGVSWRCVKNVEKSALEKKYARVPLKDVEAIIIDEMHVFPGAESNRRYITIIRDYADNRVLSVTHGKGVDAMKKFTYRLKRYGHKIKYVCMDMSNSYTTWAQKTLPNAAIVYDHFHLVKSVNDRLDHVRRRVMNRLDNEAKQAIKGKRFLLLKNEEDLDDSGVIKLQKLRDSNRDLADAHALKEQLRRIYRFAANYHDAESSFKEWISMALASEIPEMIAAGRMVESHLTGILGYWKFKRSSSASIEGFNGKVRWLMKQAYGYRDFKYFVLKIFDLPSTSLKKKL